MAKSSHELIYIGIGSNLGDRKQNILDSLDLMRVAGVELLRVASVYESEPWGFETENQFFNTVLECDFSGSAQELLQILQGIEKKLGRKPKLGQGYESRVIDLDIILFKNQEISSEELTVPHPFFAERKFVLLPLVELIENGLFHGVQNTLAECFFALDDKSKILVVDKIQLIC